MIPMPCRTAHLHRLGAPAVGAHAHRAAARDLHGRRDLARRSSPPARTRAATSRVSPERFSFSRSTPSRAAAGTPGGSRRARRRPRRRSASRSAAGAARSVAQPAGHGDLRAIGEVARPGDAARLDLALRTTMSRRGLADAAEKHARVPAVEHGLRVADGDEQVLLGRQAREVVRVMSAMLRCACGSMSPGISVAPAAVDDGRAGGAASPAPRDRGDAVALHAHVAGEGLAAAAVEDAHVGDQEAGHVSRSLASRGAGGDGIPLASHLGTQRRDRCRPT